MVWYSVTADVLASDGPGTAGEPRTRLRVGAAAPGKAGVRNAQERCGYGFGPVGGAVTETRVSEAVFQRQVIELAKRFGWTVYHVPDSRRVTVRGCPDLIMINERQRRLMFAELKSATGRLTPEQKFWLRVLESAGVETAVWRPADLSREIPRRLRPRPVPLYQGMGRG